MNQRARFLFRLKVATFVTILMSSEPTIASNSVSLSWLLRILSNSSYLGLQQLSGTLQTKTSSERKSALTDYLQKTRNHFIKLLVLVKWANTVDNNLKKCWVLPNRVYCL